MAALAPEQKLMASLKARQAELQHEVFEHPPHDYPEFMRTLGQWQENQAQQESLRVIMRTADEEDI